MANTVTILDPDTTLAQAGWTANGGTLPGILADASDSTYASIVYAGGSNTMSMGLGTFTLPALGKFYSLTLNVRCKANNVDTGLEVVLNVPGGPIVILTFPVGTMSQAIGDYSGIYQLSSLGQADVDGAYITFRPLRFGGNASINVYKCSMGVTYNQATTPTLTGPPVSNTTTAAPPVTWTTSDPEGDLQDRYRTKIFSSAVFNVPGFNPETSTAIYDSGEVSSGAQTVTPSALPNNDNYRAAVKVADAGSNGRFGPWVTRDFTIALPPAGTPTMTVTPDDANGRTSLVIQARDNMLSADDASFESSAGTWVNQYGLDGTSGRVAYASALEGAYCYNIKSGSADFNYLRTGVTTYVTSPGTVLSASIGHRAVTNLRSVRTELWWYNAAGTQISSTVGGSVTEVSGAWIRSYVTGVAPAGAAYVAVAATIVGPPLTEQHYVDAPILVPGYINLLSENASSFETDASGWQVDTNCTISQIQAGSALQGTAILKLASAGSGSVGMTAKTSGNTPAPASTACSIIAYVRAETLSRISSLFVAQYNSAGGSISTNYSSTSTDSITGWTKLVYNFTTSATTASVLVGVEFKTASGALPLSELHYVEAVSFVVGTTTEFVPAPAWSAGGLLTLQRMSVERSLDGGVTWQSTKVWVWTGSAYVDLTTLDISDAYQSVVAYDYTAPRGVSALYRAKSTAVVSPTYTVISNPSLGVAVTPGRTQCAWIKHPTRPDWTVQPTIDQHGIVKSRTQVQGEHWALERDTAYIVYGTTRKSTFPLRLFFVNDASYNIWKQMQDSKSPLLLQTNFGDALAEEYWFTVSADVDTEVLTTDGMRTAQPRLVTFIAREAVAP